MRSVVWNKVLLICCAFPCLNMLITLVFSQYSTTEFLLFRNINMQRKI